MNKVIKALLIFVLSLVAFVVLFLGFLTIREYNPDSIESLTVQGSSNKVIPLDGDRLNILTWNIGYGALGKDSDFVMDGGGNAPAASKETVLSNIEGINGVISQQSADIVMLQEVDEKCDRTYKINEKEQLKRSNYSYAYNHKCDYVPFPWPPFGKMAAGVFTTSDYEIAATERHALPCPFTWPLRIANLKRCMLVSHFPTEDGRELIIVNSHLEAYDSGEGKIAQTKQLVEFITSEYEKGNYVIAGGDFNQTFPGALEKYPNTHVDLWKVGSLSEDIAPDGWSLVSDISTPTCRLLNQPYDPSDTENTQYYVIDGFICSPNVEVKNVETIDIDFEYSDHNPVRLEIVLK